MNNRTRERIRTAAKYIFLAAVGIALFKCAHAYATAQRGYTAIGGEFLLLLFPFIWGMVEEMAVEVCWMIRETFGDRKRRTARRRRPQTQERGHAE